LKIFFRKGGDKMKDLMCRSYDCRTCFSI